ncbi:MAG: MBL fold metallo-hydrolase [Promethearchaeota archaeon]
MPEWKQPLGIIVNTGNILSTRPAIVVGESAVHKSRLNENNGLVVGNDVVVTPLAAESLGVRSLAVLVKTPDAGVLVDPGVALGFREHLHPHPLEYQVLAQRRTAILEAARKVDLIVVSHYHHDHFMPFFQNYALFWSNRRDASALYQQRRIWCKDIRKNVNWSQQGRGYNFIRSVRRIAKEVAYADGRALKLGTTLIRFSPAVPHGELGTPLGWVIMTTIKHNGVTIVHASDVQGPMVEETAKWILAQHPQLLVLAGPPTYLSPERVKPTAISKAAKNLKLLASTIPIIVVDHHLLRDRDWRNWWNPIQKVAKDNGHQLFTVAEILNESVQILESQRAELYAKNPPSSDFNGWVQKIQDSRIKEPPPLHL